MEIILLFLTLQQLQLENDLLRLEIQELEKQKEFLYWEQQRSEEAYQYCMNDNRMLQLYEGIFHYPIKPAKGLYWEGTDYYCVWADSISLEQQEKTDRHEYCHYLINNDFTHFCEVGK